MTVYEVYEAEELIDHSEFRQALELLESVGEAERDAKWYLQYCRANAGLERYYEAAQAAKKAHELEPDNEAYKKEWQAYRKYRRPYKTGKKDGFCSKLEWGDCCLELFCGGCCECLCEGICNGCG